MSSYLRRTVLHTISFIPWKFVLWINCRSKHIVYVTWIMRIRICFVSYAYKRRLSKAILMIPYLMGFRETNVDIEGSHPYHIAIWGPIKQIENPHHSNPLLIKKNRMTKSMCFIFNHCLIHHFWKIFCSITNIDNFT